MQRPQGQTDSGARLHVAVIMDGNGRWAQARGLPRTAGHKFGVDALKRTVEGASKLGVSKLTVFGFSTENWRRPDGEVSELMKLMKAYVESDLERLNRSGVRVKIVGRRQGLSPDILEVIERAEARTAANTEFTLEVAFNYGGQADITDAVRAIATAAKAGEIDPATITEQTVAAALSTHGDAPDLIIRTSGEQRLSNFLLWEAAYAEFVFQDVLWPDYGPKHLAAAIEEYRRRDRRYGAVEANERAAS